MFDRIADKRWLPWAVFFAAALVLAAAGAGAWQRLQALAGLRAPLPAQAAAAGPQTVAGYRIEDIVAAHLFGTAEVVPEGPVNAPATRLKLRLLGVVDSEDEKLSRAIIAVASGQARTYGVGDTIEKTDARLRSVQVDRVLLNRGGKVESLQMVRLELGEEPPAPKLDPAMLQESRQLWPGK